MSRPIEFDRDLALEDAMKLFWCQGYTATSLQQLLDAMAISRSSFYASFGDKRALFIECLELFANRTYLILVLQRDASGPLAGISGFFRHTLLEVPAHRAARGCMMVNSILELADVDDELNRLAAAHLAKIEAEFSRCFEAAQHAGDYPRHYAPARLGSMVMLLNQGLRVACREGKPRRQLEQAMNDTFSLLGIAA